MNGNGHLSKKAIKIGIIGGTGLDDPDILEGRREETVTTIFGAPSDALIHGKIGGVDCVLLARHGRKHSIAPTQVNYRANIWALKEAGCTHIVVSTACGSLREEVKPGDLVILDDLIDRTTKRHLSLYDGTVLKGILHMPMDVVFAKEVTSVLIQSAKELGLSHHGKGTCVTIEGPRFSTRAESKLFQSWGASVVNMTAVPEAILAKEAGLLYGAIAMATDYDCWRENEEHVSVEVVMRTLLENAQKVTKMFKHVIPAIAKSDWEEAYENLQTTVKLSTML